MIIILFPGGRWAWRAELNAGNVGGCNATAAGTEEEEHRDTRLKGTECFFNWDKSLR